MTMLGTQNNRKLSVSRKAFQINGLDKAYTLKNLEKPKLLQRGEKWRAMGMPDNFEMFKYVDKDTVQIPMGILGTSWDDKFENKTVHFNMPPLPFNQTLRPEQNQAVENLEKRRVGIMNAGTGTGKSYMILSMAAKNPYKTLIVVCSTICLKEMIVKCQEFCGVTPAVIGGTKKYKATTDKITIAMLQSLPKMMKDKQFDAYSYGTILVDECDVSISTPARQTFFYFCSPYYLYGFTATLKINMQEDRLIHLFFGDAENSLKVNNFKPIIKEVRTKYMYSGVLDSDGEFSKMRSEIAQDTARNTLIVNTAYDAIRKTETKKGLILTQIVAQAYTLQQQLIDRGMEAYVIVGETSEEERQKIRATIIATTNPVALIGSTQILGRGFDLPALQSAFVCYPNKFDGALIQVVGRVLRKYEGKTYAIIYDFVDELESALLTQSFSRKRTYKKEYGG